jgi:hypothetical protein
MYQLTYISTSRPGIGPLQIEEILQVSRRNNRRDSITGLLIADGTRFLQAIEGEAKLVEGTFQRIKADPRHFAAVMLSFREIQRREFGHWAMACTLVQPVGAGASLAETVDALVAQVPDKNTQALFSSFARIERNAA